MYGTGHFHLALANVTANSITQQAKSLPLHFLTGQELLSALNDTAVDTRYLWLSFLRPLPPQQLSPIHSLHRSAKS